MRTWPDVGRSSVPSTFSIVDLPDPDGPTIATSSPASIRSDDPGQRGDPAGVHLGHVGQFDHFGTPTVMPSAIPAPLISTRPPANMPVFTGTYRVAAAVDDLDAETAFLQGEQRGDRHGQHVLPLGRGERDVDRGAA